MKLSKDIEDRETQEFRRRLAERVHDAVANENWWFVMVAHTDGTQRIWRVKGAPTWKTTKHLIRQAWGLVKFMRIKIAGPLILKLRSVL